MMHQQAQYSTVNPSPNNQSSKLVSNVSTLVDKGNALVGQGLMYEAMQYYDKALAIDPNDKLVLVDKAYALYLLGKSAQAIQYYDKALAIDPKYQDALNGKQAALYTLKINGPG